MKKISKGFTLIELMTVVTISLVVFGAIFAVFIVGRSSWTSGEALLQLQQSGRLAMELMARELSQADRNSIKFGSCSGNNCASITFQIPTIDSSPEYHTMFKSDGTMKLGAGNPPDAQLRGATITYWVSNGQLKRKVYYNQSGTEGEIPPGLTRLEQRLKSMFAAINKFLVNFIREDLAYASGPVTVPVPACQCGNQTCSPSEPCNKCENACGETCGTCPADCGLCVVCGQNGCQAGETCESCSVDCGACPIKCGQYGCQAGETCGSCPQDCGACVVCGDHTCNGSETCTSCPDDCGLCHAVACGDGECTGGETCGSCSQDCGACAVCGQNGCETGETCSSCPGDCCFSNTDVTRVITGNISSLAFVKDSAKPGYVGITLNLQKKVGLRNATLTLKSQVIARNTASEKKPSSTAAPAAVTFDDYNALSYLIYHNPPYGCPNGNCSGGETCTSCPVDCGRCLNVCNDTFCDAGETCSGCPQDCGACPYCGDSHCNEPAEDCCSCTDDCGPCLPATPGCFLAGTPILMSDGSAKPIEEIKVGELVMAFDENSKQLKSDKVKETFVHHENEYFIINRRIKATAIHPLYSNGRWVEVKNLKTGDELLTAQGQPEKIFSIEKIIAPVTVYNLEVNPFHTYIAGGVVVHNKQGPCCGQNGCEPGENDKICPQDCGEIIIKEGT